VVKRPLKGKRNIRCSNFEIRPFGPAVRNFKPKTFVKEIDEEFDDGIDKPHGSGKLPFSRQDPHNPCRNKSGTKPPT